MSAAVTKKKLAGDNASKKQTPKENAQLKKKKNESDEEEEDVEGELEDEDNNDEGEEDDEEEEDLQPASEKPKSQQETTSGTTKVDATDETRKGDRDRRTLFIKNLPGSYTVKHIKALTSDVKQVRLRCTCALVEGKRTRIGYAYLEYASESIAEKNYKILEEAVVKGKKLVVDYVGTKSSFYSTKVKTEPEDIDPLRLYIRGLPVNATDDDVRRLFPEATEIVLPRRKKDKKLFGYGFIGFASQKIAEKYHDESKGLKCKDNELFVLYAKRRSVKKVWNDMRRQKKDGRQKKKNEGEEPAVKKVKKGDDEDNDEDDESNEGNLDAEGSSNLQDEVDDDDDDDNNEDDDE